MKTDAMVPEGVAERLAVTMARLFRRMRRAQPTHLGPGSLAALATIVADGPVRVGDLAAVEGVRAPTMSRIVDLLASEGAVERVPDPADRRACLVRATETGERIVHGSRTAVSGLLAERLGRLDAGDLARVVAALPALEALCADEPPE